MSLYGSMSRHNNLDEIAQVRQFPSYQSVATRQAKARANLGLGSGTVTAGTAVPNSAMVTDANNGIKGFRDTRNPPIFNQPAEGTLNATGTLTAALLLGGILTSSTAAAVTATLDTAANLETALLAIQPNLQNNDYFELNIINTGGTNALTVATAAGWTLVGNMVVAGADKSAMFGVRRTAANTYTIYRLA